MAGLMKPVIVIGAARSGTKFLRDLIGSSAASCVVPFDVNYVWRYGNDDMPDDALPPERCTAEIAAHIRDHLAQIAGNPNHADGRVPKFLVEKTVSNCLRVPFIDRVFPNAVYVHLVRDGRDVVESSVRMWRAPINVAHALGKLKSMRFSNLSYVRWYLGNIIGALFTKNQGVKIWGVRYPGIARDIELLSVPEICARQWRYCIEAATAHLEELPSSRVINVRYESVTSDESEVRRICDFLAVSDTPRVLDYYRRRNRPPSSPAWRTAFGGEDWMRAMSILKPTLENLGYD